MLKDPESKNYGTFPVILEHKTHGLTFIDTFYTLMKSMIGTGVLYFPKSFYQGGAIFSAIACFFVSFTTLLCMKWLSRAHNTHGGTYADLAGKAIGKYGEYLVDFMIFATQLGPGLIGVGFLLTNTSKSLNALGINTSDYVLLAVFMALLVPLCMIKLIKDQAWAYIISDFIIISNLAIISIYGIYKGGNVENIDIIKPKTMFLTLGIIVYGLEGISLILPIKAEMNQAWEFDKLLSYMMTCVTVILVFFGSINVFAYGSDLEDVITLNLPDSYWVAGIILAYVVAIVLSVPLVLHPAFQIIEKYAKLQGLQVDAMRISVVVLTVLLGFFARHSLALCVSVIGGFFCAPLAFIFPSLIHIKLNTVNSMDITIAWIMFFIGLVFGAAAVLSVFIS